MATHKCFMCPTSYTKISSYYLFCLFKMYPLIGPCHIKWSERIWFYSTSLHHREDNGSLSERGRTGMNSVTLLCTEFAGTCRLYFESFLAEVATSPWLLCFCVVSAASPLKREQTQLLCISTCVSFSHGSIWLLNDSSKSFYGWLSSFLCYLFPPSDFTNVVKVLKKRQSFSVTHQRLLLIQYSFELN